eukprot:CAMPEP_0181138042 /NCGR_PEP_ID=MMETSP1071-20121207/34030_1 /TAXON_ID=35127 /ORGANISM="Thalassiosira sp., Strain NH16" /LENGTH=440 /DNA_ID=CAMNT_0023224841 /DNA_START=615 /DNA_END=1937 /DNA_ORIENTATION=-
MNNRNNPPNPPQFEFADDSPTRPGRKHRRGRYAPNRKNAKSTASTKASSASIPNSSRGGSADNNSFRSAGRNVSSAASRAQAPSLSPQPQQQRLNLKPQLKPPPTNYNFTDGTPTKNGSNGRDDNSCAGSLTYSASSSVRSEESSNESSFADILKVIDSDEVGAATEVKEFMAKQSKAASYGCYSATGGGQIEREGASAHAAVQGWKQRQAAAQQQMKQTARGKGQKKKFTLAASNHVPINPNVDLNYSKDDSSGSGDMFGVDFDENVLETIAGHDDDVARHTQATAASNSTTPADHPFHGKEPYQTSSNFISNHGVSSAPSSPRRHRTGHTTPPPNSRHKRTSTPPGAANSISSRTNSRGSRHSKSSSDGSWDTPAPSSPPPTKPPHARYSSPVSKTNRKSRSEEKAVLADPNEAFYAKSWMCGFTDAFNFDGFDTFQK